MNKKELSLFDIATGFENVSVDFQRIKNMLDIYDEYIENEIEGLDEYGSAAYTVARYARLRSLMEVMQTNFNTTLNKMNAQINDLYAIHREKKSEAEE